MSEESFRSSCDLFMFLLELYMCLGFTPVLPSVTVYLTEPFSYCSSRAMNVWVAISIKSFTIGNFVEINPKRA
jgi:hypothetical protein